VMTEISLTVNFSACKAFGFVAAEVSPAKIALTPNQTLELLNTVTINVPASMCHWTIARQGPLSSDSYSSWPVAVSSLTGIIYTASGLCGASGTTGTFGVKTEYLLSGGSGTLTWDP
jgi:hypothetical protein